MLGIFAIIYFTPQVLFSVQVCSSDDEKKVLEKKLVCLSVCDRNPETGLWSFHFFLECSTPKFQLGKLHGISKHFNSKTLP